MIGVNEDYNIYIILFEGFSLSEIYTNFPFPALDPFSIKSIETPFPIPMQ
jgi:hypothetical protein